MQEFEENHIKCQDETNNDDIHVYKLPTNRTPRRVVPLERMLDSHDMFKHIPTIDQSEDYVEINIGLESSPKMIKVGKNTSQEEKRDIERLICEYQDAFAWSYGDLKAYKGHIF